MESTDKKMNNGIKILGASLLFLAIPGSALALPWIYYKFLKNRKKEKSESILGI
jgi:hypothetical protein